MSNLQAGVAGPEALGPDAALLPSSSKYFMTAQFHGSNPFSRCSLSAVDSTTPLPGPHTTTKDGNHDKDGNHNENGDNDGQP